jgi:hypothetical protein
MIADAGASAIADAGLIDAVAGTTAGDVAGIQAAADAAGTVATPPIYTPTGGMGTGLADLGVPTGGEMVTQGGLTPATVGQGGALDAGSLAANQSELAQSGLMGGATMPGGGLAPATAADIAGSAAAGEAAMGGGGGFSLASMLPTTPLGQAMALQGVGSGLGGLATANAAKNAAQIQANAANTAAQNTAAMFNVQNAQQAPYRGAGYEPDSEYVAGSICGL